MASPIIQLPKRDRKSIIQLVQLTNEEQESILRAFDVVEPALNSNEFINSIADETNLAVEKIQGVISVLLKLYNVLDTLESNTKKIAEIFIESLKEYEEINLADFETDLDALEQFVDNSLSFHSTLGVSAKSLEVMSEHDKVYQESKLYTDIRPIFKSSSAVGKPQAAVLIHNLKLEYHDGEKRRNFFLTLDNSDLEDLIKTLERALNKYEFLDEFLDKANLKLLKNKG